MTINILVQIILGLFFLTAAFFSFTMPGLFILNRLKGDYDDLEKLTLSSVAGLVIFTLSAYILAALNLRFIMWLFPLGGLLLFLKYKKEIFVSRLGVGSKLLFIAVIISGIAGMTAVNAPSGFYQKEGITFYSSHGHDGVWHLALMESMKNNVFPFQNPELANARLQNYHFFVDLLMSEFSRLFSFSSPDVYFRFMPVVFALLLGLSAFIFIRFWKKSEAAGIWAMIFTYFAGSFGWLLYVPTHKSLGGESIFWVSQTQSVLGNPPHAAAFVVITAFFFCLLKYLRERKWPYFILCALLGSSLVEFKIYAGVLVLGGLLLIGVWDLLRRKIYGTLLLFAATLIIALLIYLPNSQNSQDFLLFQPWWFIRTMVVAPDRLNWLDMELRRQTYIAENNWKRVVQLETTAFLIFLFGNLGMRFIGFWSVIKQLKDKILDHSFNIFFLVITTASFFIPVFFLQKGVAWNTIQFNQYFLLFFGYLAGISTAQILGLIKNKSLRIILGSAIIILAVPTQAGLLWQFYSNPPLSKISKEELSALNFLKEQTDKNSVILTAPFNKYERDKYSYPPIPIYAWYDTGYVSAFSGRQSLYSDEEQVNIMGYDVAKMRLDREEAFGSSDHNKMNNFLKKYKIDYIYLVWGEKLATESAYLNADLVFESKDAKVFKVRN